MHDASDVNLAQVSRRAQPGELGADETGIHERRTATLGRPAATAGWSYFLRRKDGRQRVPHAWPIDCAREKLNICNLGLDL